MLWHLTNETGIVRSCEAGSLAEARVRLRPIPRNGFVASDASYRLGYHPGVIYGTTARVENSPAQVRAADDMRTREAVKKGVAQDLTDADIAALAGVSQARVQQVRRRLGLPSRWERVETEIVTLLRASVPEVQIAERLGVHRQRVARIRRTHGLPKPERQPRVDRAQLSIWGKQGINVRLGRAS